MRRYLYAVLAIAIALPWNFRLKAEATGTRAEATGTRAEATGTRAEATGTRAEATGTRAEATGTARWAGVTRVQAAATAERKSARIWDGRNADFEQFIRDAPFDRIEIVPIGVTHPKRAYFKPGGLADSVAWKVLPPGRPNGYWESYKSEIAAYELDKLLGMTMVPVAVEKNWKGEKGAAILWLNPIHSWKEMQDKPKPAKWVAQVARMKMFDDLICNRDRNAGNLLVDDDWNLFLIDHSRAFIEDRGLAIALEHVDRPLWTKMLALDEPSLQSALGHWVDRGGIHAMLLRRDKMKAAIDALVRKNGEEAVFIQ